MHMWHMWLEKRKVRQPSWIQYGVSLKIGDGLFKASIINVHNPRLGRKDGDKDVFYAQMEREYDNCLRHDAKLVNGSQP